MIQTINFSQFCDAFSEERKNTFTYEGKQALYDYLTDLEEDTGEPIELDTVALCCEYTEYSDLAELQKNYSDIESIEDLQNHTQVIEIPNSDGFIIQDY